MPMTTGGASKPLVIKREILSPGVLYRFRLTATPDAMTGYAESAQFGPAWAELVVTAFPSEAVRLRSVETFPLILYSNTNNVFRFRIRTSEPLFYYLTMPGMFLVMFGITFG